jgi:hypothetical protein
VARGSLFDEAMRLVLLAMVGLVGCATAPSDPCAMAADHVASCTGEDPQAMASQTCDEARADAVLAMDCAQLAMAAAAGKADGWWDEFLCSLGLTSHCAGQPGPTSTAHTLNGTVHKLGDDSPAVGVYVRAINASNADDVHGSWTFAGGLFAIQDLSTNESYRVEVALSPTSGALIARSVGGNVSYVALQAPLP